MAESNPERKIRQLKKQPTVRQKAEKASSVPKTRRLRQAGTTVAKPFRSAAKTGRKEYYLPLPDNKVGKFMNKRRRFMPKYLREAWQEVRMVVWPSNRETIKLTFAVFMFALFFMLIISVADFGLDKVFKQFFLK